MCSNPCESEATCFRPESNWELTDSYFSWVPRSPPLSYGDRWITENPLGPSCILISLQCLLRLLRLKTEIGFVITYIVRYEWWCWGNNVVSRQKRKGKRKIFSTRSSRTAWCRGSRTNRSPADIYFYVYVLYIYIYIYLHICHQEITLVYICRIRIRLYVIKSLNDIYMSNNF